MKINWLWDSSLDEKEAAEILKDATHPKYVIYASKLLSRVKSPQDAFTFIKKLDFCRHWPRIKKRMKKDKWASERVVFWQIMYDRLYEDYKKKGIRIRHQIAVKTTPEKTKLARHIREIRKNMGYTQQDMAKKLGVIQQYVSKIETGRENLSIDSLRHIAAVLKKKVVIKLT